MTEMEKLQYMLKGARIPFDIVRRETFIPRKKLGIFSYDGEVKDQIVAPDRNTHAIDAICQYGSYGYQEGLLEVMGPRTVCGTSDGVVGYLTAEQAFELFEKWRDQDVGS